MTVDHKEIERIIDYFETEAEKESNKREYELLNKDNYQWHSGSERAFLKCAAVLRQLIPHG